MRITSVELHPMNSSQAFVLSFKDPAKLNPYNVKSITGLDASDIVARYYSSSGDSTNNFFNLSLVGRDVVILVELNPQFEMGKTYSDLRDDLYKMIASSRTGLVQIQFKNGTDVIAAISGLPTKFEASHFDKTPAVQITISATDPVMRALTPTVVDVTALDPASTLIQDLVSTAPHGFAFDMNIVTGIDSLVITDPTDLSWSFTVTPAGGFLAGDVFHMSSDLNDKEIYITRGGVRILLADIISSGSVWPIIFPGDNHFAFTNPTDIAWSDISYFHTYWGV